MLNLLRYPLWALVRLLVSLRYRVVVHGAEQIRSLQSGILILPNHCGYIDPVLLLTILWPSLHPRPMLLESSFLNYRSTGPAGGQRDPSGGRLPWRDAT
jgi:1-acyl-sn-glycerol-3-phosphate acyltransferase